MSDETETMSEETETGPKSNETENKEKHVHGSSENISNENSPLTDSVSEETETGPKSDVTENKERDDVHGSGNISNEIGRETDSVSEGTETGPKSIETENKERDDIHGSNENITNENRQQTVSVSEETETGPAPKSIETENKEKRVHGSSENISNENSPLTDSVSEETETGPKSDVTGNKERDDVHGSENISNENSRQTDSVSEETETRPKSVENENIEREDVHESSENISNENGQETDLVSEETETGPESIETENIEREDVSSSANISNENSRQADSVSNESSKSRDTQDTEAKESDDVPEDTCPEKDRSHIDNPNSEIDPIEVEQNSATEETPAFEETSIQQPEPAVPGTSGNVNNATQSVKILCNQSRIASGSAASESNENSSNITVRSPLDSVGNGDGQENSIGSLEYTNRILSERGYRKHIRRLSSTDGIPLEATPERRQNINCCPKQSPKNMFETMVAACGATPPTTDLDSIVEKYQEMMNKESDETRFERMNHNLTLLRKCEKVKTTPDEERAVTEKHVQVPVFMPKLIYSNGIPVKYALFSLAVIILALPGIIFIARRI